MNESERLLMFRLCFKYLRRNGPFYLYFLVSLCSSIVALAIPLVIGMMVNQLIELDADLQDVLRLCLILFALGAVRGLLVFAANCLYVNVQAHAGYRLNADVLEHMQKLPQSYFESFDAAYVNQQINHDANNLLIFAISSSVQIASNAISLIAIVSILLAQNPMLAVVCIVLACSNGILYVQFRHKLFSKTYSMREQQSRFFSSLQAQLSDIEFIRRHALFRQYRMRLEESFGEFYPAVRDAQIINYQFELGNSIISAVVQAALFAVGAFEVISGALLAGYLISAMSYYESLSSSVQFFLTWGKTLQDNRVCYERLRRILDVEVENNGEKKKTSISSIELKNVSCSWQEGLPLLQDVSLRFEKGKLYGIAGANGCGKSTLLDVLLGMGPGNLRGIVRYDGTDLREVDKYYLRENGVGIAEQSPKLVPGSMLSNLLLCAPNRDLSSLDTYLDIFDLRDVVGGAFDEVSRSAGQQCVLSGGEKQKIAIVRLLLQSPEVMLFDEPTSALDAKSRSELISLLEQKKNQHVIIAVSHDERLLDACDVVFSMNDGKIIARSKWT
ncbi:ATP-binding cassette domain-containing protein [Collinsella intestinalis]|uniref:ATP-binding cassette domain-containing protein n=1 Tax=Collinsella intestinalis TaxID=147207 RepID=UPI00195F0371|nr:ABC transporter ATP-binding protein [Collinsella intestinalis]MBM6908321.1 ABC transporter ATP-binding protein [Collinsella intestinalis]